MDSQEEMVEIKQMVSTLLQEENSVGELQKLTGMVVKKAFCKMKAAKSDVSGAFITDALLHAPDSFFELLAMVYRSWLVHGTVTPSLLACALNPADTNSYVIELLLVPHCC